MAVSLKDTSACLKDIKYTKPSVFDGNSGRIKDLANIGVGRLGVIYESMVAAVRRNGGSCWPIQDSLGLVYGPEIPPNGQATITVLGGGRYKVEANTTGRLYFDLAQLSSGKTYKVSFDIESFEGSATFASDWCDSTNYPTSYMFVGSVSYHGQRATYDMTYRFVDITTGPSSTLTINNVRVREVISASLYQDTAGTLPVTTQGQVIGLSLDQSYGSANLGSELTPTGYLTNTAIWTVTNGTASSVGGKMVFTATGAGNMIAAITGAYPNPASFNINYKLSNIASGKTVVRYFRGSADGDSNSETQRSLIVSSSNSHELAVFIMATPTIGQSFTVDGLIVKQVLGVHLTQSTGANKPVLTRVPKRLGSELNTSGSWSQNNAASLSVNSTTSVTAVCNSTGNTPAFKDITAIVGKSYLLQADVTGTAAASWITGFDAPWSNAVQSANTTSGHVSAIFTPTTSSLRFGLNHTINSETVSYSNISVREVLEWSNAYQFDGSNDTLTFTPPPITTAATLGWAGTISSLVPGGTKLMAQGMGGIGLAGHVGGAVALDKFGTGAVLTSGQGYLLPNVPVVITAYTTTGGSTAIRVNGVQVASGTNVLSAFSGSLMGLMWDTSNSIWTPGTVTDAMVTNTIMPLADLKAWERNACSQLGITYAG